MMWMDFECETSLVAKMPKTSQHFFVLSVSPGVYPIDESMASFFLFFLRIRQANAEFPIGNRVFSGANWPRWHALEAPVFLFGNNAVTFSRKLATGRVRPIGGLKECARVLASLLGAAFRLLIRNRQAL